MKKSIVLLVVFWGCLSFLSAQHNQREEFKKKMEDFRENLSKDLNGKMLNDLLDFDSFNFQLQDSGELEQRIEEWKKNSEEYSQDLAMKIPELSGEFSNCFPESFSIHFESKENKETWQDNDELFNKLSDIKDVEVVYITKSLLGMLSTLELPNMIGNGVDIRKITGKLESLQIFSSEQSNAMRKLKSESDKLVKNGEYETLMFIKDQESKTVFYMNKLDNHRAEMLMISEEPKEFTVIRFTGNFTIRDLQEVTKNSKKSK